MPRFIPLNSDKRPPLSIEEFHRQRKKVLVMREVGGLGDILMHRMMFEDFKRIMPDAEVVFACPEIYHEALYDHPYIDTLENSKKIDYLDYVIHYNTTSACTRHESRVAPFSDKHRSDIWANHCGVELEKHNMHIMVEQHFLDWAEELLRQKVGSGPRVAIAPVSAMVTKNLLDTQLKSIVNKLREKGCLPFGLHTKPLPYLSEDLCVPVIYGVRIRQWMALLSKSDYVISVDSAAFHYAGGIKKPLLGVFTWADGKTYGKYFDFVLVQKHRDNGDWDCGPCYLWGNCPKCKKVPKPCLTEISDEMLAQGIEKMFDKWPVGD